MNLASAKAWLMQPTTVSCIGTLLGGIIGAATQYYAHDPAAALTLFAAVKGVASVALPDNSAAQGSIQKLIQDAATAAVTKHLGVSAGQLAADGLAVMTSITAQGTAAIPAPAASAVPGKAAPS